jgi:NADPH-dependent ferric siderophore reductase
MTRRPPPPFLPASVAAREWLTPRLVRVSLEGARLKEFEVSQPASSVRVLLPRPDRPDTLELPTWDGNQFLMANGRRPILRTLTPRHHDRDAGRLQVDVVVHGDGAAATWASKAAIGTPAAVSGPARGYTIEPQAEAMILGGDETAIPAISQIVEALPEHVDVTVFIEVADDSRPLLPGDPEGRMRIEWVTPDDAVPGQAVADRLGQVDLAPGTHLWAAGEAGSMQRIRQQLLVDRGLPRSQATIRGFWKRGRASADNPLV